MVHPKNVRTRCISEMRCLYVCVYIFSIGDRYDWTTRVSHNGNEWSLLFWRKFRVVPHSHPLCPLDRDGNRRASTLPGEVGIMSIVRWSLRPVIFGVDSTIFPFGIARMNLLSKGATVTIFRGPWLWFNFQRPLTLISLQEQFRTVFNNNIVTGNDYLWGFRETCAITDTWNIWCPKDPSVLKKSTESKFGTRRKIRNGDEKTLQRLRNACLVSQGNEQKNNTDNQKLRL